VSQRIFSIGSGRVTAKETERYAAEIAQELTFMCERVGLVGLSTLPYAVSGEAERAAARLSRQDPSRRHG
jgi:hypothetical protein